MTLRARRALALAAAIVAAMVVVDAAGVPPETPAPRRADARAYDRLLAPTRNLPRVGKGAAYRTLDVTWQPRPRAWTTLVLVGEPRRDRQVLDATCDADLVAIGRLESATPFLHPNERWILTVHDVIVSQVVRARDPALRAIARLRDVHPSGTIVAAARTDSAVVDRYSLLATDEDYLFFLVRIPKSPSWRASLDVPVLALRGGSLYAQVAERAAEERRALDGVGARDMLRAINAAVCRPARVDRSWRPGTGTSDGRLPPFSGPPPP